MFDSIKFTAVAGQLWKKLREATNNLHLSTLSSFPRKPIALVNPKSTHKLNSSKLRAPVHQKLYYPKP